MDDSFHIGYYKHLTIARYDCDLHKKESFYLKLKELS